MTQLKKTLFATLAAAAATVALAGPAAAQPYGHDRHDRWDRGDVAYNINARQAQLEQRIEWGIRRGTLDRREARELRREARDVSRLEADLRRGGLTASERRVLDRRLDRLELAVARQTRDRDYGYGYRR